ncbi:MAG: glycosyltransferase [Campylobacterota bacterium]|nr:glycosyltransferase [Campylobacterota bacterium]
MKKILIFTDSFLPGYKGGGPVTSINNLVNIMKDDFEILICTSNHDFGETQAYKNIISDTVIPFNENQIVYLSKMSFKNIFTTIKKFDPDVLYLNSFFSITTQIVMFLNKLVFHKKVVLAPRGELQVNALNIKKNKKLLFLRVYKFFKLYNNVTFHSTDIIETQRIKKLFRTDSVLEAENAVKVQNLDALKKAKNELKLVFISRISRKKNLHYALSVLKSIKHDVVFDIYGPKEDLKYWKECQNIINQLPENVKVTYKGVLQQKDVIRTLRMYHSFFFPTVSENFGHVIVEAMQAGIVPIISNQTPWVRLEDENAGYDIGLSEKNGFIKAIEKLYLMDNEEFTQSSLGTITYIQKKLNIKKLSLLYINFFSKITKNKTNVQK